MIHVLIARALMGIDPADYVKVLDELALAERQNPDDPDIFYLRGKAFVELKRDEEAVRAFRRAMDLRPLDTSAYYQLARLYQKLGKTELAKQQFERVKALEPEQSRPQGR
jgi:tetratricopeptide (TPR) repeat protein